MSRGLSSTVVVGVVIVIVAVAAAGGYFLTQSGTASSGSSSTSTSSTATLVGLSTGSTSSTISLPPAGKYANVTVAPATATVSDPVYSPATVTVIIGVNNTVVWTNTDRVIHMVVADDNSFTSPILSQGQVYIHQFNTPGTFTYHDGQRPNMRGTVIVKSA